MDKRKINAGKIGKAARWMDMGDEKGAISILNEVVDSALITDDDPINYCEAHLFLSDIAKRDGDKSKQESHLQSVLSIDDDRAAEAQRQARDRLSSISSSR